MGMFDSAVLALNRAQDPSSWMSELAGIQQLRIYAESRVSWSIWLYKDIGYQGMVYVDPESAYMKLICAVCGQEAAAWAGRLGITDREAVKDVYDLFLRGLRGMVGPELLLKKYPPVWTFHRQVERIVRECLLSEYLGWEFAELFRGEREEELEELA